MVQTLLVIAIVALAAAWLGRYAWKALGFGRRGGGCAGGCGCGHEADAAVPRPTAAANPPSASNRTVFIASDDLARRAKLRQQQPQ